MSVRYLEIEDEHHGEYYALLLLSVVGMMCMAAGIDIVLIFIGLELMAISIYVLVGFLRRDRRSNEAALKYLLLGAFSSGIFAYGLSLFYGLSGSTNLSDHRARGVGAESAQPRPGHRAADDHGRPALQDRRDPVSPVGARRLRRRAHQHHRLHVGGGESGGLGNVAAHPDLWVVSLCAPIYTPVMVFVAIATMTGANLAALTQTNTKRLLAYSSIAHVGYMLLAFVAMGTSPSAAPAFRRLQGNPDLPAGLHVHEPGRVRGDHFACASAT